MHVYERVRAYVEERGLEPGAVASTAGIPRAWFAAMLAGTGRLPGVPCAGGGLPVLAGTAYSAAGGGV